MVIVVAHLNYLQKSKLSQKLHVKLDQVLSVVRFFMWKYLQTKVRKLLSMNDTGTPIAGIKRRQVPQ